MKLIFSIVLCFAMWRFCEGFDDSRNEKKNVIIIMADDLGFNDVSFRGSNEIPTPNIDALAYNGAIMNRFYTPLMCTPSRASLLTGKYPYRLGMQHFVIPSYEPWALGKDEKLLPQYFKDAGYSTHLIGKWHLGFYQRQYTPTVRGFDTHYGYLGPYIDYFDYTLEAFGSNLTRGYDMRKNLSVVKNNESIYATNLFTNEAIKIIENHDKKNPFFLCLNHLAPHAGNEDFPMQAPAEEIEKFSYIKDEKRRTLAAMISILDQGVGDVMKALADNNLLHNTVVVFYSDNGGPTVGQHSTSASNYPLRGQKESGWEGAIRTNAIVYAPFLKNQGVVRNQLMHVSDLFPTLLGVAGLKLDTNKLNLDGVDQWEVINKGGDQVRKELVDIDDVAEFGAYILFPYKLVNGSALNGEYDGWLSSKNNNGDSDPMSYASLVMNSLTSRAIRDTQQTTRLTVDNIFKLRQKATVNCCNEITKTNCDLTKAPCLFNLHDDPCEENNLAEEKPEILTLLLKKYNEVKKIVIPTRRQPSDPACDPKYFNNNWQWWQEDY